MIFRSFSLLVGRICMSLIFLLAAFEKLLNWHDTEKMLISTLSEWQVHMGPFQLIQNSLTFLVSWSSLLLVLAVSCELLGGLLILIGFKERFGAILLILFLIPTTLLFHSFWFLEDAARELQMTLFLKNLAIMGGLIFVAVHGARPKERMDSRHSFLGMR